MHRDDEQRPLGGWKPLADQMAVMVAAADAIIAEAKSAAGDPLERYRDAEMRIFFAMRPEFGPANAALPRDKQLRELATAVGLAQPPEPVAADLDAFVAQARATADALRKQGWTVEEGVASSRAVLWQPDVRGWRLTVVDPSRLVDEFVPYSRDPSTKQVNPSIRLWLFPHVEMSTSQNQVRREQPGTVEAAGPGAVLFRLQPQQSRDQDDGALSKAIIAALALDPGPRELADVAKRLGGGTATLANGVITVSGREAPKKPMPALEVTGAHALVWSVNRGVNVDHTLLPLR